MLQSATKSLKEKEMRGLPASLSNSRNDELEWCASGVRLETGT